MTVVVRTSVAAMTGTSDPIDGHILAVAGSVQLCKCENDCGPFMGPAGRRENTLRFHALSGLQRVYVFDLEFPS